RSRKGIVTAGICIWCPLGAACSPRSLAFLGGVPPKPPVFSAQLAGAFLGGSANDRIRFRRHFDRLGRPDSRRPDLRYRSHAPQDWDPAEREADWRANDLDLAAGGAAGGDGRNGTLEAAA